MEYINGANTVKNMMNMFSQKQKERTDMILEPLQAMIQLSLLPYSQPGTKLAIHNNILILHPPSFTQGFLRWYTGDGKDDLYYLFHVFRRFIVWYSSNNFKNTIDNKLYNMIINNAFHGIDCLMKTYKMSEMGSLFHVLQMYKTFLQKPYYFIEQPILKKNKTKRRSLSLGNCEIEETQQAESETSDNDKATTYSSPTRSPMLHSPSKEVQSINIDMIFIQSKQLYSEHVKTILVEIFSELQSAETRDYPALINGMNKILYPITRQIQPWIKQKLVF